MQGVPAGVRAGTDAAIWAVRDVPTAQLILGARVNSHGSLPVWPRVRAARTGRGPEGVAGPRTRGRRRAPHRPVRTVPEPGMRPSRGLHRLRPGLDVLLRNLPLQGRDDAPQRTAAARRDRETPRRNKAPSGRSAREPAYPRRHASMVAGTTGHPRRAPLVARTHTAGRCGLLCRPPARVGQPPAISFGSVHAYVSPEHA